MTKQDIISNGWLFKTEDKTFFKSITFTKNVSESELTLIHSEELGVTRIDVEMKQPDEHWVRLFTGWIEDVKDLLKIESLFNIKTLEIGERKAQNGLMNWEKRHDWSEDYSPKERI